MTLNSSFKYIGRSNAVSCPNGWNYYILLYAKTSINSSTGAQTVTVLQRLACTSESTFYNWNTTGKVTVAGSTAFSWSKEHVPSSTWNTTSLTAGSVTYKRWIDLKSGSVTLSSSYSGSSVSIVSSWQMNETYSAGWFPYSTEAKATISVTLPATASTPTLNKSSVQMGSTLKITTNRQSSSFTHTLYYTFGGTKKTMATGVGASYTWTVPDLAAKCDNATSGTCTITCVTYNGSTSIGTTTKTVTLTVPAATTPSVSPSSANMGSKFTISLPRKSANFTHKVTYNFASGAKTGTISSSAETSATWTPSLETFAPLIPSKTSGKAVITVQTYNGTASVGSKTVSITLKVPENSTTKPTISMTIAPSHSLPNQFKNYYIQSKSKVNATIQGSSNYSNIAKYTLNVGGSTKSLSSSVASAEITSALLGTSGVITVKGTVTDARGYSNSVEISITVYGYSRAVVIPISEKGKVICERSNSSGVAANDGTYLHIAATRSYSPITIATNNHLNYCYLRYRIKARDASTWGNWATLISGATTSQSDYDQVVANLTLSPTTAYIVEVGVYDAVGGEADADTLTFSIPTDEVTFHLTSGGGGAAFGQYNQNKNRLEVAPNWDTDLAGNVYGKVYGLGKTKTWLTVGEDVNDCHDFGVFRVETDSTAEQVLNLPSKKAGRLIVSSANGTGNSSGTYVYIMQEYITYQGDYYYRLIYTSTDSTFIYNDWQSRSDTGWISLGLSSNVENATSSLGRVPTGCYYRVINGNHVYVAFNCKFAYSGSSIIVNNDLLPEELRPARNVYEYRPLGGKYVARIIVTTAGNAVVEWVQNILSTTETTSRTSGWIDGYIDYWV